MADIPVAVDISKNLIREHADKFVKSWKGAKSEHAEKQTFWNDFLSVFGVERRRVATFELLAERASTGNRGWIDLLYPGQMAVEHKSLGEDLDKAMGQLLDYLPSLHESEYPWLLVVCDFKYFEWKNLETGEAGKFALEELPRNLHLFWWMAGHETPRFAFDDSEEANLHATSLLAKVHDGLLNAGYDPHALREWMTRILFCLFADNTEVWDRAAIHTYLAQKTCIDGTDLGPKLAFLFQVLNTSLEQRPPTLDEELQSLTYINGDLFDATLPIPACNEEIRTALLDACGFNWSIISPAIFGSMFQNVMTPSERRELGAHYTTEENIMKTIRPLFLDELEKELEVANSKRKLNQFHEKLSSLKFLDPACGCGNFLVIAYREIRRIETKALRRLAERARISKSENRSQLVNNLELLCKVKVDQFYGIEIEEFPARIARTALYLIDHIANREISAEFGQHFVRFPIPASPHIVIGNALRIDWNEVLPGYQANYVFGNPPFVGSRMASVEQKADQDIVWSGTTRHGTLDYVSNWFKLASEYMEGHFGRIAFVATNSISQGEQPAALWQELWKHGMHIDFAYRTFAWSSEARGKAAVHVVIIGFSALPKPSKLPLWNYVDVRGEGQLNEVKQISPYLIDAPEIVISSRTRPLVHGVPPMRFGSMPRDNGYLSSISLEEAKLIRESDLVAAKYLHALIGAEELLNKGTRFCLWLVGAGPSEVNSSKVLRERISKVKEMRLASKAGSTRAAASTPGLFVQRAQPSQRYLAVPGVSSESRDYLPTSFFEPDVIASNALLTIEGADLVLFGTISSKVFMAWNRTVSGRLESRFRISQEITYNNFPWLSTDNPNRHAIEVAAKEVLNIRDSFPNSSLAELYNPLSMPLKLVQAHKKLDQAVLKAYKLNTNSIDAEILSVLFNSYQELMLSDQLPGVIPIQSPRKRRKKLD